MRRLRLLAASVVLISVTAAQAQDNFPDVPANHWAYEALNRMKKDGLLVGYPDGLFRGGRPASRYELAVAMHAVYTNLKNVTDGLDSQLNALKSTKGDWATQGDVAVLKEALAALQTDLAAMKGYGQDIADLKRASDTFEKELTQLGVNVQAMKDDLKDLAGRVKTLEDKKPKIAVSGGVDFWFGGGESLDQRYGLTRDGRITGTKDKNAIGTVSAPVPNRAGITNDYAMLHEAAVTLTSTNETGVKLRGTFVASNSFGQDPITGVVSDRIGFGNQSDLFSPLNGNAGNPSLIGYADGASDLYIQELVASFGKGNFSLEAGRVRHKATPWIFQRIDNTSYFNNDRWDDGQYTFDGLVTSTKIGPVKAEVYGGKTSGVKTVNGLFINPLRSGAALGIFGPDGGNRLEAEQTLGGTLSTSVKGVSLRADYLVLDTLNDLVGSFGAVNHVDVYGGEANFNIGRFKLEGGLRQTKAFDDNDDVSGLTDNAWDAKVSWGSGRFDLAAQYREVGLNYMAPGDWGRLGVLRNPTNVRGFLGSAKVALTPRYSLGFEGELSHGLGNSASDVAGSFFDRDTNIGRYAIRLDGKLSSDLGWYANYEETNIGNLAGAPGVLGDPRYRWYGLGLSHSLSGNAKFSLAYEQSAIKSDYQTSGGGVGNSFRGGFLTSQFTVKF
jgi:hypothetical protein